MNPSLAPENWPPPVSLFTAQPIGLVYFAQQQFRYYLHQHIFEQMRQLEARKDVMQLDHRGLADDPSAQNLSHDTVPHAEGDLIDIYGRHWAADVEMLHRSFDLSNMDLDWVDSTGDRLFRTMTRQERYLLYLLFVRELTWDVRNRPGRGFLCAICDGLYF